VSYAQRNRQILPESKKEADKKEGGLGKQIAITKDGAS
jgi:hypothetical protein